jgi:integrase
MYVRPYRGGWRTEVQRNGQRLSKTFKTKREAQAWGIEQEASSKALGKGWRTFGQAVEAYQASYTDKKPSAAWERNTLARLVAAFGEDTPMGTIDQPRIAAWRDERLKTVSGSTVQREANVLRHLFHVARDEWHWIHASPFQGVKLPAENRPREAVWPWQLIKRVLRARRDGKTAEMQRAFHIALRTGMRLSEVLTAKLSGGIALLPKDKMTQDGPVKVPLTRHGRRLLAGSAPFTVDPNEGSVLFGKLCRELLIEGLTFHDSRATALTHLARKVDVLTLSKISRHRDLRILQNTYYRETPEQIAARL